MPLSELLAKTKNGVGSKSVKCKALKFKALLVAKLQDDLTKKIKLSSQSLMFCSTNVISVL